MATRLYVSNPANPTWVNLQYVSAAWDVYGEADVWRLDTLNTTTNQSAAPQVNKDVAGPVNVLISQFILPGLDAQTISGTVKGIFRFDVSNTLADACVQTVMRVVDLSTGTVRGTLLAATDPGISATVDTPGYEISTSIASRRVPTGWSGSGATLTSVDAEAGDALVIEVGARVYEVASTLRWVLLSLYHSDTVSDRPEDETTTTTTLNPWIEFSDDIAFSRVATVRGGDELAIPVNIGSGGGSAPPTTGQTWPRS